MLDTLFPSMPSLAAGPAWIICLPSAERSRLARLDFKMIYQSRIGCLGSTAGMTRGKANDLAKDDSRRASD